MKYFLVFYDDEWGSSPEAASVFYSWLVKADSEEEAIQKYVDQSKYAENADGLAAQEMDLIE